MSRHHVVTALLAVLLLLSTAGCMGRMALTGKVRQFNMDVTEEKWGREVVFVGLYIVPVYPTCTFADLFIVNSLEFWNGTNPVSGEPALTEM